MTAFSVQNVRQKCKSAYLYFREFIIRCYCISRIDSVDTRVDHVDRYIGVSGALNAETATSLN